MRLGEVLTELEKFFDKLKELEPDDLKYTEKLMLRVIYHECGAIRNEIRRLLWQGEQNGGNQEISEK